MLPTIQTFPEKKLVGMRIRMSLADYKTFELWSSFMPRRQEIKHRVGEDKYSVEMYESPNYFSAFNPANMFDKWAAVEVGSFEDLPGGMEALVILEGLYAVFIHKGPAALAAQTFNYIFRTWLPRSEYEVDNRPHFEIMDVKYIIDSPESEEEVWVPVRKK